MGQHQPPVPPGQAATGRPRSYPAREVVNAALYIARTGCAWRLLPHDFPPWGLVSYYFYTWRDRGLWAEVHAALRGDAPRRRPRADALRRRHRQSDRQDGRGRRTQGVRRGKKKSAAASATSWLTRSA